MKLWRWCGWAAGGAVLLVALLAAWGALPPISNTGSRSIEIARPPATVWAVLTDAERAPRWQPMLARVKRLTPTIHEMTYTDGIVARAETTLNDPPRRLVEHVLPDLMVPFRGGCSAELAATETGTRVTFKSSNRNRPTPHPLGATLYIYDGKDAGRDAGRLEA